MESIDDQELLFLGELHGFPFLVGHLSISGGISFAQSFVEPFLEIFARGEDFRKQKIEQGPEFTQVVLKWGTC
jgi:hypothetical protein